MFQIGDHSGPTFLIRFGVNPLVGPYEPTDDRDVPNG